MFEQLSMAAEQKKGSTKLFSGMGYMSLQGRCGCVQLMELFATAEPAELLAWGQFQARVLYESMTIYWNPLMTSY